MSNEKIVTISARTSAGGRWWDISVTVSIDAATGKQFKEEIDKRLKWLGENGFTSTVAGTPVKYSAPVGYKPPRNKSEKSGGAPPCLSCNTPMSVSNVQRKKGFTAYFCSQKLAHGYCNQRASVNNDTAEVSYWETKAK